MNFVRAPAARPAALDRVQCPKAESLAGKAWELASAATALNFPARSRPAIVRELVAMGKEVFLDLKLHEIPNSIFGGISAAGKLVASMVTVHASGGSAVLKAAVTAAAPYPRLKVLALTVITSLSDSDLPEIGLHPSIEQQVDLLSQLAANCGCHCVVASAQTSKWCIATR